MSKLLADSSWSFLKITNGILALARNSLDDIDEQFQKQESELISSVEQLVKCASLVRPESVSATESPELKEVQSTCESVEVQSACNTTCNEIELYQKQPKKTTKRKKGHQKQKRARNDIECCNETPEASSTTEATVPLESVKELVSDNAAEIAPNEASDPTKENESPENNENVDSHFSPMATRTRSRRKLPSSPAQKKARTVKAKRGRPTKKAAEVEDQIDLDNASAPSAPNDDLPLQKSSNDSKQTEVNTLSTETDSAISLKVSIFGPDPSANEIIDGKPAPKRTRQRKAPKSTATRSTKCRKRNEPSEESATQMVEEATSEEKEPILETAQGPDVGCLSQEQPTDQISPSQASEQPRSERNSDIILSLDGLLNEQVCVSSTSDLLEEDARNRYVSDNAGLLHVGYGALI